MVYLYIDEAGEPEQTDVAPVEEMAQMIIDLELEIYRFNLKTSQFEKMTPIDGKDIDNWSIVPIK